MGGHRRRSKDLEMALTNRTIQLVAQASPEAVRCANGLNVVAVARALCDEAEQRGLKIQG